MRPAAALAVMGSVWLATGVSGPPSALARPGARPRTQTTFLATRRESSDPNSDRVRRINPAVAQEKTFPEPCRGELHRNDSSREKRRFGRQPEGDGLPRKFVKRMNVRENDGNKNTDVSYVNQMVRSGVVAAEFCLAVILALLIIWRVNKAMHADVFVPPPLARNPRHLRPPPVRPRPPPFGSGGPFQIHFHDSGLLSSRNRGSSFSLSLDLYGSMSSASEINLRSAESERASMNMRLSAARTAERAALAHARAGRAARQAAARTDFSNEQTAAGVSALDAAEVERAIVRQRHERVGLLDRRRSDIFFRQLPLTTGIVRDAAQSVLVEGLAARRPPARRHSVIGIVRDDAPAWAPPLSASLPDLHLLRRVARRFSRIRLLSTDPSESNASSQ